LQELFYTVLATISYIIAFIVILSGFGYCAGTAKCDARIAAGVRNPVILLTYKIFIYSFIKKYLDIYMFE
jgi:hypothetical protein